MSGRPLSPEDRRELSRLTKMLTQKVIQVVVQSRFGTKAHTRSKSPAAGTDWFNLGIDDNVEILTEIKKNLGGHTPEKGRSLVVEILLTTPSNNSLVLELWTLNVTDANDTSPARVNPTIYNRMTVLLKSLLSVTRITPAYKLAFRQGPDSFIMCYRIYFGDPDFEILGENYVHARLGQVCTPDNTLVLTVAYRTQITLGPQVRAPVHDPVIMLKSDHFKPEISPRHCRRGAGGGGGGGDRGTDSSEAAQTSDDSQDTGRLFTTSPPPSDHASSPRSRTSSESSNRGNTQQHQQQQQPVERKISVAFADIKPPKTEEFFLPDIPFSNLLTSTADLAAKMEREKERERERERERDSSGGDGGAAVATATATANIPQSQDKASGGGVVMEGGGGGGEKGSGGGGGGGAAMSGSDASHKSTTSTQLKEETDFVMVELKTPFAGTHEAGTDLGAFYRECQTAPQLRMFADTPEDEISDLAQQLLTFEGYMDDYNELVRSLHSEDSPGTSSSQ